MSFLLFPGQGSQKPGMGQTFHESSQAARAVFETAADIMSGDFLDLLFRGSQDDLNDTRNAQPALVTVEVAVAAHLQAAGLQVTGAAGHSVGEIAALTATGVLPFDQALKITCERARLMSEDVPPGGMCAVLGLDADAIESLLPDDVQVANYNGPNQTIISGSNEGLEAAAPILKEGGAKRVLPLKVSGPFHSKYMESAAAKFAVFLEQFEFAAPSTGRFVSSVTGGEVTDPGEVRALLAQQLYSPVRWTDVLNTLGAVDAVEAGPGNVLQGIAKRMDGAPAVQLAGTLEQANTLIGDSEDE